MAVVGKKMSVIVPFFISAIFADAILSEGESKIEACASTTAPMKQCTATGADGAAGMSVSWGVDATKCISCGPSMKDGGGVTYEYQFKAAFKIKHAHGRCQCVWDKKIASSFTPTYKGEKEACLSGVVTDAIKTTCWDRYMKIRSVQGFDDFKKKSDDGERTVQVPRHVTKFTHSDFTVQRCNEESAVCEGTSCEKVVFPDIKFNEKDRKAIGAAMRAEKKGEVMQATMMELIDALPPSAIDDCEFASIDEDQSNQLSTDELVAWFTNIKADVIAGFVAKVDTNGDGEVGRGEFDEFKELVRNYDPNINVDTGGAIGFTAVGGDVGEAKASWKATAVACMKGNELAAEADCAGNSDQALEAINAIIPVNLLD